MEYYHIDYIIVYQLDIIFITRETLLYLQSNKNNIQ
jgi:hypothetical protein